MDHGSDSRPESEINLEEIDIERDSIKNLDSSGRSSASSNSSSGDFFQVIPHKLTRSHPSNGIPKPNGGIKQLYKEYVDIPSQALYRLEESIIESPESASQCSDITHESLLPPMSPTQSPSIQVMERPGNFDPSRIPASIFSKPLSPMEWSVASNESLFSIHIGNHSFRGHASKRVKDSYRSGELVKSEEIFNSKQMYQSGELHKSGELYQSEGPYKSDDKIRTSELSGFGLTSAAAKQVQPYDDLENANNLSENMKPRAKGAKDEAVNDVAKVQLNQGGMNLDESNDSVNTNRLTDRSEAIVQPIIFPKKKNSACPLCYCFRCSRLFSSCKWQSCFCKWPRGCCRLSGFPCKLWSWPSCSSSCFNCPSCSNSCLSCPSYFCKWPKCRCKWPNCFRKSCCAVWHWKSCWPGCNCKCPSWPSCHCKFATLSSCCCKCSTWRNWCCTCSSWPSCKCQCFESRWFCCCCGKSKSKKSSHDSSYVLAGSKMAYSNSEKAPSSKHCSCFSCHSCSCCC